MTLKMEEAILHLQVHQKIKEILKKKIVIEQKAISYPC